MGQTQSIELDTAEDLRPSLRGHSTMIQISTTVDCSKESLKTRRRSKTNSKNEDRNLSLFSLETSSTGISSVNNYRRSSCKNTKDLPKDHEGTIAAYVKAYESRKSSESLTAVAEGCKNRSICKQYRKSTRLLYTLHLQNM
ncbi:unnamed protein product [Arctia plantaginis]|uniref:Uncharacterized protein n=1 Tax=Arctia plantaginis TaxID=874455 RepID=A0A8S0YW80_ARCPL|nr:unnamed protein product [Arctia plantaginis]CAB3253564.1 unnamed protein product [Arctia plantaginis]